MAQRVVMLAGVLAGWLVATPEVAEAYVGPGAGITVIGSVIALVSAIGFAIVGLVWYPIKRLRAKRRNGRTGETDQNVQRG